MLRAGLDTGWRAIGALVVSPSFTATVSPNHTHLGDYTRTVSLHRVALAPLISVSFHAAAAPPL
jgi:hypothetical protein